MALDFPSSPTNGQAYNGYTYSSSIGAWQAKPAAQSPFYTSATPPSNPVAGDSWFNTSDGTLYVYYNDGNTSQWVEHRSQIARNQVGLVPIVPTSVTVGSGTASISSSGDITCTSVSSISFNSVFNSSFKTYKILMTATGTANLPINLRLRSGTTDATAAVYQWMANRVYFPIAQAALGSSGAALAEVGYTGGNGVCFSQIELSDPYNASNTFASMHRIYSNESVTGGFWHNANTSYDGFTIYPTTSTISGTFKIYGYN